MRGRARPAIRAAARHSFTVRHDNMTLPDESHFDAWRLDPSGSGGRNFYIRELHGSLARGDASTWGVVTAIATGLGRYADHASMGGGGPPDMLLVQISY